MSQLCVCKSMAVRPCSSASHSRAPLPVSSSALPTRQVVIPFQAAGVKARHQSRIVVMRSQAVPGSSGGVPGQMTSAIIEQMKGKISEALETDKVAITDVYGDGRHVTIEVVSKLFADKNSMQRQRMVYKAIWLELQEAVHAVDSMVTKTPEEL